MDLGDLIEPQGVIASLKARSKKHVIEELAVKAAEITGLDEKGQIAGLF